MAFGIAVAYPGWAFSHEAGSNRLRVHAATPLPDETADWARQVMADLEAGPLPPQGDVYHIYISGGGWRETLFFAPARGAGGLVYALASGRNVFLSGADIMEDRLLKGDVVIQPPRTLSYYARHELTHLAQRERLGVWRYFRMTRTVREGIADYVALGPADADLRDAVATVADSPEAQLQLMMAFGAYPQFRVDVTDALQETTLERLMTGAP